MQISKVWKVELLLLVHCVCCLFLVSLLYLCWVFIFFLFHLVKEAASHWWLLALHASCNSTGYGPRMVVISYLCCNFSFPDLRPTYAAFHSTPFRTCQKGRLHHLFDSLHGHVDGRGRGVDISKKEEVSMHFVEQGKMTMEAESNEQDEQWMGFGWMFTWELLHWEHFWFDGSMAFSRCFECSSVDIIAVCMSMPGQLCMMLHGQRTITEVRGRVEAANSSGNARTCSDEEEHFFFDSVSFHLFIVYVSIAYCELQQCSSYSGSMLLWVISVQLLQR